MGKRGGELRGARREGRWGREKGRAGAGEGKELGVRRKLCN